MRTLLVCLALATAGATGAGGCYVHPHQYEAVPAGLVDGVELVALFAAAQTTSTHVEPTNGCLPDDYYVAGANYVIRATRAGCEWIAWDDAGLVIGQGMVPRGRATE